MTDIQQLALIYGMASLICGVLAIAFVLIYDMLDEIDDPWRNDHDDNLTEEK